jgi:hypothetical protein
MTQLKKFAPLLIAPMIQACGGSSTLPPETISLLQSIPRVDNSPKSPCWQQKQIAAQNTAFEAALKKSKDTYKPPCEFEKAKPVEPQKATS